MTTRVTAATWLTRRDGDGAVLAVRPHYADAFFLPGGTPEAGESLAQAAAREVAEEVGLALDPESVRELVRVTDQAHGRPAGDAVLLVCFAGSVLDGTLTAGEEIADIAWLPPSQWHRFAGAVRIALAALDAA